MALDGIAVAAVVKELNELLSGGRIARIGQPEKDEILLTVRTLQGQKRVLLSASASLPLIYLTDSNKPGPMTAPNFCMLLRKYIGSGKILRVWQPGLERIVHFEFEHYDELGDLRRKDLILELMGKYSNLIFCDEEGTILDAIKHIGSLTSSIREVLPGRKYFIPDTQHKDDPLHTTEEEFLSDVFSKPMPLAKALYSSYTGISPLIAEEVSSRASLDSAISAREIPDGARLHLYRIFQELMEDVKNGVFEPAIISDEEGMPVEFSAVELSIYKDLDSTRFSTMSELLEAYYAKKNAASRIRQKSSDLRRLVGTLLERESRKLDLQRKQQKDTQKREKYRLYGELLHTYGYSAEPGAKSVTVPNYYDNDAPLTIPLDPLLTAQENARRYFDRYSKQKRTFEALEEQIAQTQADVDQLDAIKTFLDQAQTEADLTEIHEELSSSGFVKKKGPEKGKGKGKVSKMPKSQPWHYRTEDGYDIYVGKNNLQNDELTFHFASGNDWWFHAKKIPGSHVIVKSHGTETLPDSVFEDAASLAAYYSRDRESDKVEIDYVKKKEVKKPNGSKPGFVIYYSNYSMVARPDISRLTLLEGEEKKKKS